ncbi:MAG: DUF1223 domain-containing protein [Terracidiphilus sp.]|jgi:hypothetical protein
MGSPILTRFRSARLALVICIASGGLTVFALGQSSQDSSAAAPPVPGQPVLVELFTSEGCSDCPPADALLERLDSAQFVPGAQAIVLSEHVTYWNHLGWRDPFSFDAMTERQEQYVVRFGLSSSYTPQMVVDGAEQFVGNDPAKLGAAVARAAARPKPKIAIEGAHWDGGALLFSVRGEAGSGATLVAVLAQNETRSVVARGENAGRTLHHVAVVRAMKDFGSKAADGRSLRLSGAVSSGSGKAAGPIRLVVFLADRKTGYVLGVAEQILSE